MLSFDKDTNITFDQFLASCRTFVSEQDIERLESIEVDGSYHGPLDHPFLTAYSTFTNDLKEELFNLRKNRQKSHKDSDDSRNSNKLHNQAVLEVVKHAAEHENPLEAELSILQLMWQEIEYLKDGHSYDDVTIFAYALQLRILERKALFIPIEGNAEFKQLFTNLQSSIKSL
jgi:hypothetical protein